MSNGPRGVVGVPEQKFGAGEPCVVQALAFVFERSSGPGDLTPLSSSLSCPAARSRLANSQTQALAEAGEQSDPMYQYLDGRA